MTNQSVIKAWVAGRVGSSGNMLTDGVKLYSYNLLIGTDSGTTIFNHTSGGGSFYSQTTSCHVGLAKRLVPYADIVRP